MKTSKNYRLSEEALQQIEWLGKRTGKTATDVVEAAVNEMYEHDVGKIRLRAVKVKEDRYNLVAGETVIATINQAVLDATRGHKKRLLSKDGAALDVIGVVFLATAIAKSAYVGWNQEGLEMLEHISQ